jgi:cobalamin biosynthesis protein CobD/CbiB
MGRSGLAPLMLLGTALGAAVADPAQGHPVAGCAAATSWVERQLQAGIRLRGALFALLGAGSAAAAGLIVQWHASELAGLPGYRDQK